MNGKKDIPLHEEKNSANEIQNTESSASCETSDTDKKVQFSGQCSVLVSLLGYSMGTSDFWRFPYLVFRNGGGAFLIPFALFMLLVGLPMLFFEISMSQFSGKGPLSMWDMAPFFKGIGYTLLIINLINNVYYNVLRAWILEYLTHTFQTDLPWKGCNHEWNRAGCVTLENKTLFSGNTDHNNNNGTLDPSVLPGNMTFVTKMTAAEQYWQFKVLQLSSGLGNLDGVIWHYVLFVFFWRLLVFLCMIKSIKSIEKVMYVTVFVPIVIMIMIWIRSLMLEGSIAGMMYYITPTLDRITDPKVWLEAAMMACYTLGPGWGTIPLIGSHNKFHGNTIRYSFITTGCDFLSAVMNGLICFSVLGVMAHDSGLDLEKTVTSGLSLGFTVYPTAFTYFPLPQLWTAVFFINLMLVGLDSQILSAETVMNCFEDLFPKLFSGKRRVIMIALFNVGFFLLTIPLCTRGGIYIFLLLDWYAAAWTLLFVCLAECIVFTWIYGTDRLSRDVEIMTGRQLPLFIRISGSFCAPLIILVLLILSFIQYRPPSYGNYSYPGLAEAFGWCLAVFVILPIFVVFLIKIVKNGGALNRIYILLSRPSKNWAPNDEDAKASYHNHDTETRSLDSTVFYNITGRHRKPQRLLYQVNGKHEISPLFKEDKLTSV